MTVERLALLAAIAMAITGGVVYMLSGPARPSTTAAAPAPEPPPRVTQPPPDRPPPSSRTVDPPGIKDWDVTPAARVDGAQSLHCTAKVRDGWLRVACEGANDAGGTPFGIRLPDAKLVRTEVGKAGIAHVAWKTPFGPAYTAAGEKILSLVCPFEEGVDLLAELDWSDRKTALQVSWPRGAEEPETKARFRPR